MTLLSASQQTSLESTIPLIQLDHVGVVRGNKRVLSNINLTLRPTEIISVIGPNGGGKSTLIQAMLGLISVSEGTVTRQPNLRIGYVPQNFAVPSSLPLRVVDFLNMTPRTGDTTALYAQFAITPLLSQPMQHLSGGELQRVLLANALLNSPNVVILDEPMQGLDPDTQHMLYPLIRQLPEQYGCAVVMVSHDLHWVMQGTQHVICINQHICCEGKPADIQNQAVFKQLYQPNASQLSHIQQHDHAGQTFYAHHHDCEHEHDCDDAQY